MEKKVGWMLSLALVLGNVSGYSAFASGKSSTEDLLDIQQKKIELKQHFQLKEAEMEALNKEAEKSELELKKLDSEIGLSTEKIRNLTEVIGLTGKVMEEMKSEIEQLNIRIEKREGLIKERLRTMQSQGGVNIYIDMVMGVKSFSQLFDLTTAVTTILHADRQLLQNYQQDLELKAEQEKELKEKLVVLDANLEKMESLKQQLQEKMKEKQKLVDSLKEQKKQNETDLMDMYEVYINLTSQEIAMLKEAQANRIEYMNVEAKDMFMMPTTGTLTSGYGPRDGKQHFGIDIADSSINAKVVAAASGTVIRSYYSTSYGNCVMVTHKLKNKIYTTLYAHLEKSLVTTGQVIQQGEMLGYMGNTGNSTGKHLHFEIHEGEWNASKSNSVDPLKYVGFSNEK